MVHFNKRLLKCVFLDFASHISTHPPCIKMHVQVPGGGVPRVLDIPEDGPDHEAGHPAHLEHHPGLQCPRMDGALHTRD